ncbi:hypothetical protein GALMADRAFT_213779 [Galerina marginata CBS 339.88]|uniref:F-box domain-containing protein n=1 Tax=Galerina marginata (strain CBS 339.88) TaxID=685588 RepID=A0A067SUX7_GALM3|nr:hypothetical protein GALMADRAFT_213779 [Galerina marginata CBS 339.88]
MCIISDHRPSSRSFTHPKARITPTFQSTIVEDRYAGISSRLPAELFRPIIGYITHPPTLHAIALTCRFLLPDAQKQLYANIPATPSFSLSDSKYSSRSSSPTFAAAAAPQMHIAFLHTITSYNPALALLVKFYHSPSIVSYNESPLWDLTIRGLRMMHNLKHLHFRAFGGHPAAAELLWGCKFRLETLIWGSHSDESAFGRVLQEQDALRELYLECRDDSGSVNSIALAACSSLTALGGNRTTVEALLPGRGVRRLAWVPDLEDDNSLPLIGMEKALGELTTLSFGGYFSRPGLERVVYQLRGLEVLELVGLNDVAEISLMKHIKNLRELVVSCRGGSPVFPIPLQDRELVVQNLFSDCPKLLCIDIAHSWQNVDEIKYQRWIRGEDRPLIMMMEELSVLVVLAIRSDTNLRSKRAPFELIVSDSKCTESLAAVNAS